MNVRDLLKDHPRVVAIVHFRSASAIMADVYRGCPPPQNPACNLQVALLESKISPSGNLIRLGDTRGDEIVGWMRIDALEVVEVLGALEADGETVTPVILCETAGFERAAGA